MHGVRRTCRDVKSVAVLGVVILVASISLKIAAAEARCELSLVQATPSISRVSLLAQQKQKVQIERLGHSSFLLTSPAGTTILTDPNMLYPPSQPPTVVTMSNEHTTHNQINVVPGNPMVLRGSWPRQKKDDLVRVGDVLIQRLPSNFIQDPTQDFHAGNGIFLFGIGDLCIAHFGNLRQRLSDAQLRILGRLDVMMVPIDQYLTIGYDEIIDLILRVRPSWVLPIHYDDPGQPHVFVQFLSTRARAQHIQHCFLPQRSVTISRQSLPRGTEVLILGAPTGPVGCTRVL